MLQDNAPRAASCQAWARARAREPGALPSHPSLPPRPWRGLLRYPRASPLHGGTEGEAAAGGGADGGRAGVRVLMGPGGAPTAEDTAQHRLDHDLCVPASKRPGTRWDQDSSLSAAPSGAPRGPRAASCTGDRLSRESVRSILHSRSIHSRLGKEAGLFSLPMST
jgi:hypothetical protein